jgi:uncharacterized protein YggE
MKSLEVCAFVLVLCFAASGQTTTPRPIVRSVGDATITTNPDQAKLIFSVETRGTTAQDAAAQNAVQTSTLLGALQKFVGPNDDIKTLNYSVNPIYTTPPNGGTSTLAGFTASNSVQVTLSNLALVGQVLDTGSQSGATRVQTLSFTLKDPEPFRLQALRQAAAKARTHADAMTGGAGLHVGNVITMGEGSTAGVVTATVSPTAGVGATTPIDPGTVSVTATVTMEFEIVP